MVGGAAQQLASDCRLLTPFVPLSGAGRLNVSIRRNSWLSRLISQVQRLFLIQLIATEVVTAVRWMVRCCTLPGCSVVLVAPDVYPWPRNVPDCLLHCHAVCHYTSAVYTSQLSTALVTTLPIVRVTPGCPPPPAAYRTYGANPSFPRYPWPRSTHWTLNSATRDRIPPQ